jgi:hypothetical protein
VRIATIVLTAVFLAAPLGADTCLSPKSPVPATVVCGHVFDQAGGSVANVELQLISNQTVIAKASADPHGSFMFGPVPKGDYDLTAKEEGWHLFWPVRVTSSKVYKACPSPLRVVLSLHVCGQSVSKKGYHAKFGN